ncbi:MAG TPA: 16S rRNA (adenine(1518)-N(6)/adenine(1519)-N(6))-dimethyltransferase RsmA [Papillibacter sp.]|nr:16S rRNA (adenine(1518)-N(6)/adenine(1519)-N(6))-dimethyltransferase RsmA [Papillibacter sp.]
MSYKDELKRTLAKHGFRFSKSMGQNFLIDPAIPCAIAENARVDEETGVLEIGPGIGILTRELAERAGKVTSVELDRRLLPILSETLHHHKNVIIVPGDIMMLDLDALIRENMPEMARYAVCANLPYNITTPVLTRLYESHLFDTVTVMVQREVAQRMVAKAGSPDYGAFTVFTAYYAEGEILFDVPPESFVPPPKVTSSVIRLSMRKAPPEGIEDTALFFRVVRASFAQRRKTLVNSLAGAFGGLDKEGLREAVLSCGFDERIRGEMLSLADFTALAAAIGEKMA